MRKLLVLGFVGLLAQLIDGSLGMAHGVTSSPPLLAVGVAPAAAPAGGHLPPIRILALPGFVGAFAGATFLASLPGDQAKPWVAGILLCLGVYVIYRFLR